MTGAFHCRTVREQNTMIDSSLKTDKCLNRVFLVSFVFGVFPISYDFGRASINYKAMAVSLMIRALFLAEIIYLGTSLLWETFSSPEDYIDEICIAIQYSASFAFTIYMIWNKPQFTLLNQNFMKIESEFIKLGTAPSYEVGWSLDIAIILLALVSFLAAPSMIESTLTVNFCCKTLFEAGVVCQCFAIVQPFVQCVRIIGNRFSKVREILLTLSKTKNNSNTKDKMESTIRLYNMLSSTCELIMELYSLQLLFVFFLILLKVVMAAFKLLLTIKSYSKGLDFILYFLDLTYHTVVCVYTTTYCKRTSEEADEFNSFLNELMVEEDAPNIVDNRKMRLHIIMKREVTFNALGFLNLDYTLVHSVIAAATTYLVILLQFADDTPSPTPQYRNPNDPY